MTRRLMKYVGHRDGRDVYATTLCPLTGVRRLVKDTGRWHDGRRVFETAECTVVPCVTVACCPVPIPRALRLTINAPDCPCFDGRTIDLDYVDGRGWGSDDPGPNLGWCAT